MQILITKGTADDTIVMTRRDGTSAVTRFPKKGPVPHDAVHFFVESELGLTNAFWGMVAGGRHPEEIAEIAKQAGHASAKRADIPQSHIVELLQAERLVECFEADLWSPGAEGGDDAFLDVARTACEYSHVSLPLAMNAVAIGAIRRKLAQFFAEWQGAPAGHQAKFNWAEGEH